MKLVPEQVVGLRKAIIDKRRSLDGYRDYLEENRTTTSDDISRLRIGDSVTENGFNMDRYDFGRYTEILENAEIITQPCFDHVDVGTKFVAVYDGEDEETVFTLVESAQFISALNGFVSVESPLGKAALGHKEGDHCTFNVGDRRIGFTIKKIDKDMNNYLRPITSVRLGDRRCRAAEKEVKEVIETGNVVRQEELRALTHSQTVLLKTEYNRLKSEYLKTKDNGLAIRMANIKKALETRRITHPEANSDRISVGSLFSVKLISHDDEIVLENVELINCAVSDEYSFEYVERVGAIGFAVDGLRERETFKVRIGNKHYTGVVYNINNTYATLLERGNRR